MKPGEHRVTPRAVASTSIPREFTSEQQQIANLVVGQGVIVVNAAPGSGKTTTLAYSARKAIESGVPPHAILMLTFSRSGKKRLEELVAQYLPALAAKDNLPNITTFHAFGGSLIRELTQAGEMEPGRLIESTKLLELCQNAVERAYERRGYSDGETYYSVAHPALVEWLDFISTLKNECAYHDLASQGCDISEIAEQLDVPTGRVGVFCAFESLRKSQGSRTFDDLIYDVVCHDNPAAVSSIIKGRYSIVLVDEFHDINEAQLRLIKLIINPGTRLMVVGDDQQCVHTWMGADPAMMRSKFLNDFPAATRMQLSESFRFGHSMAEAINKLMRTAAHWEGKSCVSRQPRKTAIKFAQYDNTSACATAAVKACSNILKQSGSYDSTAILVRDYGFSTFIETALSNSEIPYEINGASIFLHRNEILALRGLLHLANGNLDTVSNSDVRKKIVAALVTFPGIGLPSDKVEIASNEVAETGQLVNYAFFALDQAAKMHVANPSMLSRIAKVREVWQSLIDGEWKKLPAVEIVDKVIVKLGLIEEISRQYLRSDSLRMARLVMSHFGDFLRETTAASTVVVLKKLADLEKRALARSYKQGKVQILSFANAKGREWDNVIIPFIEDGIVPLQGEDRTNELRLFYVAVSRVRENLFLLENKDEKKQSAFAKSLR